MGEADQKTPEVPSSLNDHTALPARPPTQPSPPLLQQGRVHTPPRPSAAFLATLAHPLWCQTHNPFPAGMDLKQKWKLHSRDAPPSEARQAYTAPRAWPAAPWLFPSLGLLYPSLWMMSMSKAAAAIRGDCSQHPSQIGIFPCWCTPCHVSLNLVGL